MYLLRAGYIQQSQSIAAVCYERNIVADDNIINLAAGAELADLPNNR